MKILCLADLHIRNNTDAKTKIHWAKRLFKSKSPDVVVISGDIFEANMGYKKNPYKLLSEITNNEKPIVCTLGNHEFVDHTVISVLSNYIKKYKPELYNVHYLDVVNHYDIGDIRFLGNVLWYDGSMKVNKNQRITDWGNGCWLDKRIVNFNYLIENRICVNQIKNSISEEKTNVLVTHTLPHSTINAHEESELSAFSGMKNLLKDINVQYSISGHTHRRMCNIQLEDVKIVNVGNDYYPPYQFYLLEI